MLPERFSNGVCSLKPEVDRLTHSVFIQFDKRGVAKNARFARTVIRMRTALLTNRPTRFQSRRPDRLGERLHLHGSLLPCSVENDFNTARWTSISRR